MKRFLTYCFVFTIPLIIGSGLIQQKSLDRRFAYTKFISGDCSGHGKWLYDRIYENNNAIDIAFLGSSATWNGIDDKSLTEAISNYASEDVFVTNLGYCRLGTTLYTMLVEDLVKNKNPKHIIIEVLDRPGMGSHPMFGYMASSKQVISPPTILYNDYISDVWKSIVVRWEQVRNSLYQKPDYQPDLRKFGFTRDPNLADPIEMEELRIRKLSDSILPKTTVQEHVIFHLNWKNVEHISSICKANDVQLSFFFINRFGRPIKVARFDKTWKKYGDIWYPPDTIYQDAGNYFDAGHLNKQGASKLVPFLEKKLTESYLSY